MRKRLLAIFICAFFVVATAIPALACTPPLNLDIWGDLTPPSQIEYEPSDDIKEANKRAAEKWLEEHPIDLSKETETETEIVETEYTSIFDWASYFPESLRDHWRFFVRR